MNDFLKKMFIDQAKPAMKRHSGSGGVEINKETLDVTENGTYTPSAENTYYNEVNVNVSIPEGYLKPEGTLNITANGTYNVSSYAKSEVNVEAVSEIDGRVVEVDVLPELIVPSLSEKNPVPSAMFSVDEETNNWNIISNSGPCDKIYLNTSLSIEETVAEIKKVTRNLDTTYGHEMSAYQYFMSGMMNYDGNMRNTFYLNIFNQFNADDNGYYTGYSDLWGIYLTVYDPNNNECIFEDFIFDSSNGGWNSEFNGVIDTSMCTELFSYLEWNENIDWGDDYGVNPYVKNGVINMNDSITNLVFIPGLAPNPKLKEESTYKLPDKTLWMFKNGGWNEVKIVDDGIIKVNHLPEKLLHTRDVVPNSGLAPYQRIMLNTSLTDAEVLKELQKLSYVKYDDQWSYSILYYVDLAEVGRPDQYHMLSAAKIQKQSGVVYGIVDYYYVSYAPQNTWYWQNGDPWNEGNEYASFIGWNPNAYWVEDVNNNYSPMVGCVLSSSDDYPATFHETTDTMGITMNAGLDNEKITNLLYIETDETYPNPDYDPEATYKLPDGTYWINQNDYWFQYIEFLDEYYKTISSNSCVFPTTVEFENRLVDPSIIEDVQKNISNIYNNTIGDAAYFNTSGMKDMSFMFCGAVNVDRYPIYDTSSAETINYMFYNNDNMVEFPNFDFSKVKYAKGAFAGSGKLISPPSLLNANNLYNIERAFTGCSSLPYLPEINMTNVVYTNSTFYGCHGLTGSISLDMPKVAYANQMFGDCYYITEAHFTNSTKLREVNDMFANCYALETVTGISLKNWNNSNTSSGNIHMFSMCEKLKNVSITDIPYTINFQYSPLLTVDSLIGICKECIKPSSSSAKPKLYLGSTNKEKLTNIYVKFTDPSVTTISSGSKGNVEVCESTDEGAMTIEAYMALKNWTLA